jgi:hypothetical protein
MLDGLGHRVVWYMVMNVLEEKSGSSSQAVMKWRQNDLTETSVPTSHTAQSHNSEDNNFES